jgi:cytochrome P450
MVRVGPNTISVDGSIGWPQVYATRGKEEEYQKLPGIIFKGDHIGIITAPYDTHRRMRRQLAHGFSAAALREQDHIVLSYVDKFIGELKKRSNLGQPFDIVMWFHYLAFDIIGDLVYADSFHSLENPNGHGFVHNLANMQRGDGYIRILEWYPFLKPFVSIWFGKDMKEAVHAAKENAEISHNKARERMALGAEPADGRRDISTYMLKKNRDNQEALTKPELEINSQILIGAGSDTTASVLSGLCFFLSRSPERTAILLREIHGAFKSEDEITQESSLKLEYLRAFLEEVMRLYPAAATTPPRVSPGAELNGKWVPAGVSTIPIAAKCLKNVSLC